MRNATSDWIKAGVLVGVLAASMAGADTLTAAGNAQFTLRDFVPGSANIAVLTDFAFLPDGRVILLEQSGKAKIRRTDGVFVEAGSFPVRFQTGQEWGLLGVAVDPDFATTKTLFFYYTLSNGSGGTTDNRVVSVVLKDDNTLDMSTQTAIVQGLLGPANHNGGAVAIGPDKRVYVGVGDTGCNSNKKPWEFAITNYRGTCLTVGNGKILRVDRDGGIPSDNPLVNVSTVGACGSTCTDAPNPSNQVAPRRDIYAWGFRNPFRISFDPVTGKLWVADVGEVTYEEINVVSNGNHYGWPYREGDAGTDAGVCAQVTPSGACAEPTYFCQHGGINTPGVDGECTSITGGVFVDSCGFPDAYRGQYFFGDEVQGGLFSLKVNAARDAALIVNDGGTPRTKLGNFTGGGPTAFRVGNDGNLYVSVYANSNSRIVQLAPKALDGGASNLCGFDGGPGTDAGADAGPGTDAGVDAGPNPGTDAGTDAGTGSDGGEEGPGGGCGCSTAQGMGGLIAFAFAAMVLSAMRRRKA